jgi:hypothetical protein
MELHGAILVIGVVFLMWRKPAKGIRLRLRGAFRPKPKQFQSTNPVPFSSTVGARPQVLNVHFMFNGHSFDAYEVLGLPAGSGWDRIENAYRSQLAQPSGQSKDFLDAAMMALRQHLRAG